MLQIILKHLHHVGGGKKARDIKMGRETKCLVSFIRHNPMRTNYIKPPHCFVQPVKQILMPSMVIPLKEEPKRDFKCYY